MYDVIVIGARAAGSPLAMQLALKGCKVLLVDRASFPSDTLSSHQIQVKGGAELKRWGLLDKVLESNCPPAGQVVFNTVSSNAGSLSFHGRYPALDGVQAVHSPRRIILDKILVDAAVAAGAELRQDLLVEELLVDNGRVTGIRARLKSGAGASAAPVVEQARLVVGADGKHSLVARTVHAPEYHQKPALTCAYYTYWEGLDLAGGELYSLPHSAVGLWPTNDRLAIIYTAYPIAEFQNVRANLEARFWQTVDALPELAGRVHNGRQAERFYGTADLPGFYRQPFGPGWALVGDAGMTLDPVTGQGIGNAFKDASRLAEAIEAGFSGKMQLEAALGDYQQKRDAETLPMYEFTAQLASFLPPSVEQQVLFAALEHDPDAAGQFFGVLSGSLPFQDFFAPSNLFRIMGLSGMGRLMLGKLTAARHKAPPQALAA